jgi:membrane protease YdiL (CAAX protease family)
MTVLRNREGRIREGWKAFGFLLLTAALVLALNLVFKHMLHVKHVGDTGNLALSVGLVSLASWICLRLEGKPFASMGYDLGRPWLRDLALGTLGGAGIMAATALATLGAGGFHWVRGAGTLGTTAWGLLLFVLVAFNEETLFRGYLFQRLVGGLGAWPAQALMAALFALAHWGNPGMTGAVRVGATLNIGLAALLLGLCYLRTGSLALPIGVHLGWNFTQGNLLGFGVSGTTTAPGLLKPVFLGRPEWLTGGAFGLEAGLPCALVCTACVLALALWKARPAEIPATTRTA